MEILLFAFVLLLLLFVLPLAAWASARRTRGRVLALEEIVEHFRGRIQALELRLQREPEEGRVRRTPVERPAAEEATEPVSAPAATEPEVVSVPPPQAFEPVAEAIAEPEVVALPVEGPAPGPAPEAGAPAAPADVPAAAIEVPAAAQVEVPLPTRIPEPPGAYDTGPPPPSPPATRPGFDWEGLVGIRLFSAIAGIALVVAAIFFLRYSIEHGWLQPPVRVAIGVVVAVALLVVCELKAARRYPVTANALDAAAVAILFATFFAAHALWDLIPASVTFGLLALVTAVAVLLSIRRESLFIAVLGLLGGFSTPALLSSGENRPIPLFTYLLLLNIGLAWVAQQRGWRVLSWLTLILTTAYQWGWVVRFLHESSLSLAMGIFIVFPIASLTAFVMARRGRAASDAGGLESTSLISAVLPLAFVTYLASVPEYGPRAALLFGFLLFVDIGLLTIAIARGEEWLHGAGAVATLLTTGIWLALSYPGPQARHVVLWFTIAGSLFYLLAPLLARRLGRPFQGAGVQAQLAAPLLLFVLPVLTRIEASFAAPWPLVGALLLLVCANAGIAISSGAGALYYVAAFFAVATQATWSAVYLSPARLGTAVAMYTTFALVSLLVPILARRRGRPLEPAWGGGAVLIISLALLLFLSARPIAPTALWALALLLAILNGAIFVEGAAGALPWLTQTGSVLSWIVLATWWGRAAGAVGVLPSLIVLAGLTLVTLAGHAWSVRRLIGLDVSARVPVFTRGLYLGLSGHLFLLFLAMNREWAMPPWPLFGTLVVITLAVSAGALAVRVPDLHIAGTIGASLVVSAWGTTTGEPPWPSVALVASAAVSAYAIAWIGVTRRRHEEASARGAGVVLIVSEIAAILLVDVGAPLPFQGLLLLHTANLIALLVLTARYSWRFVAGGASGLAWVAVLHWQASRALQPAMTTSGPEFGLWPHLLLFAGALYAVFIGYALTLGRRRVHDREPYIAAIVASAMLFFAARVSLMAGRLDWMLGAVPVLEGAVLATLLRQVLRLEAVGERDLGRIALVGGAALAFATVAIPVQFERQWVTIGWALEGAALAWLYRHVPHKGLLASSAGLLSVVFVRLALNPDVLTYEPRGGLPVLNWYLYTYAICAACCFLAARWLAKTDEVLAMEWLRPSRLLPAAGVILLFLLLNIEIADYYATGPALTFRFGATVSQDLTYTFGWLVFGMTLLAVGIYGESRGARIAALGLIAVTTFKCFLYDLRSLEGLYRVASFVGLALCLALVSLALQKFVATHPSLGRGKA